MNSKLKISIAVIFIILVFSLSIFYNSEKQDLTNMEYSMNISSLAVAGNQGYVVYSSNEGVPVYLLALDKEPIKKVYLLKRGEGIGINNLENFIGKLNSLSNYGIEVVEIFSLNEAGKNAFVIIPQGAIPESAIDFLNKDITFLYIGKTDILYQNGAVQNNWYDPLDEEKKKKIILYNFSLDELYSNNLEDEIINSIAFNNWSRTSFVSHISKDGIQTLTIPFSNNTKYLRFIYPCRTGFSYFDSQMIIQSKKAIILDPAFPFETRYLYLNIENSTGIPKLIIFSEDKKIFDEKLGTIEQDVFFKAFSFNQSGDYIIRIEDYTGEIASGIFHVYDLNVEYEGTRDFFHDFYITLDSNPVHSQTAKIWISDPSDYLELSIYSGKLSVPAKLKQGENVIYIQIYDKTFEKTIFYDQQSIFDIYINYGPFVAIVIILIYSIVLLTKKQQYRIKFGSCPKLTSGEIKIKPDKIKKIIPLSIKEFGSGECISPKEFSLALKKYATDGYDVLDGNAEAILKYFEKKGNLASYRSYYSDNTKQDIKKIVINRLIREKLIENGIQFKIKKDFFETENYLIFSHPVDFKTTKKTVFVFENQKNITDYLESLGQKNGAKTALKIRNNMLLLISIDELADYL